MQTYFYKNNKEKYFNLLIFGEKDVGCFDVSVNNMIFMQILYGLT